MEDKRKGIVRPYYVINWDTNRDCLEHYEVMNYFVDMWYEDKERKHKLWVRGLRDDVKVADDSVMPTTIEDFKKFVKYYAFVCYWSRCEYEVIVHGWPIEKSDYKLDVYEQIIMNLESVADCLMVNILGERRND